MQKVNSYYKPDAELNTLFTIILMLETAFGQYFAIYFAQSFNVGPPSDVTIFMPFIYPLKISKNIFWNCCGKSTAIHLVYVAKLFVMSENVL